MFGFKVTKRQPDESTVSFHNFESQNFKLSVSNPKSKQAAYLSVLSQISNCQSVGRKNKFEILKTDRSPTDRSGRRIGVDPDVQGPHYQTRNMYYCYSYLPYSTPL